VVPIQASKPIVKLLLLRVALYHDLVFALVSSSVGSIALILSWFCWPHHV